MWSAMRVKTNDKDKNVMPYELQDFVISQVLWPDHAYR